MLVSVPTAIGSLAAAMLIFIGFLTLSLAILPWGRPFLGYAHLVYRGRRALSPESGRAAPVTIRLVFVLSYLVFAASAAGLYMWKEFGVFESTANSCIRVQCVAAGGGEKIQPLPLSGAVDYKGMATAGPVRI